MCPDVISVWTACLCFFHSHGWFDSTAAHKKAYGLSLKCKRFTGRSRTAPQHIDSAMQASVSNNQVHSKHDAINVGNRKQCSRYPAAWSFMNSSSADVSKPLWQTLVVDFVPVCSLQHPLLQLPWAVAVDQGDERHPQVVSDGGRDIESVAVQVARDQVAVRDHRDREENGLSNLEAQGHTGPPGAGQSWVDVPAEQAEASQDGQKTERHQHSSAHRAVKHQGRRPRQAGRHDERSTAGEGEVDLDGAEVDTQSHAYEHDCWGPYGCDSSLPPATHEGFIAQGPPDSDKAVHGQSSAQEEVHLCKKKRRWWCRCTSVLAFSCHVKVRGVQFS